MPFSDIAPVALARPWRAGTLDLKISSAKTIYDEKPRHRPAFHLNAGH